MRYQSSVVTSDQKNKDSHVSLSTLDRRCSPIRLGIIGCGYWGAKLLRVFDSLEDVIVTHVCDQDNDKRQWIETNYPGVDFQANYQYLLSSDCDAIITATPAKSHYEIANQCLDVNKHVFVEKPVALNHQDANSLVTKAMRQNLSLFVGHIFEYDPSIAVIRNIIQSGELGDIYYFDSLRTNLGLLRLDVNVVWDLLVHDISILNAIFDTLPIKVSAIGSSHVTRESYKICESCQVNMQLPNGIRASAKASWLEPFKTRIIKVIGSQSSLVFDPSSSDEIHIYDSGIDMNLLGKSVNIQYRKEGIRVVSVPPYEPLTVEAQAFIDSILRAGSTNVQTAVEIVNVLEAIQTSLNHNGAWSAVVPDPRSASISYQVKSA